jgi:hypothetical protein
VDVGRFVLRTLVEVVEELLCRLGHTDLCEKCAECLREMDESEGKKGKKG